MDKQPDDAYYLGNKGKQYLEIGQPLVAIEWYDKALLIYPEADWIITMKGDAIMEIGHPDEALKLYTQALEIDPDNYRSLVGKANAYSALNQIENAVIYYNRALDVNSNGESARERLNQILTKEINKEVDILGDDILVISEAVETLDIEVELLKWFTILGAIFGGISLIWLIKRRHQHRELLEKMDEIPSKINKRTAI